jgi:ribulose-phosphate 3-epimerase
MPHFFCFVPGWLLLGFDGLNFVRLSFVILEPHSRLLRPKRLAPSLLACDFSKLGAETREVQAAGADWLHFDVMDGTFVPNLSIGLPILEATRKHTTLPIDVHLMVQNPERFFEVFAKTGADVITFHAESTPHAHSAIQQIHDLGIKAGLAVNPGTPLEFLKPLLPDLDVALVMSVNPGFGGQKFIPQTLDRLRQLDAWRNELNPDCLIEVDGGVNLENVSSIARAGADVLVAGSAIFNSAGIAQNVNLFRSQLSKLSNGST